MKDNDGIKKMKEEYEIKIMYEMKDEITKIEGEIRKMNMERKGKVIQWKDIKNINAVRHACKASEHLNKRAKYKKLENYHVKIHRVGVISDECIYIFFLYKKKNLINIFFNQKYEEMVAYIS